MMITVYTLDPQNIFIAAVQVDPMGSLPAPCTLTEPPKTTGTQVAQWAGDQWLVLDTRPPVPGPSVDQVKAEIMTATQQRLDTFAKTRLYDGVLSLCTYASSANPKFMQEGQYGVEARDTTWATLYEIMEEVQAGTRPMPTGYADIESELPPLVWPN
jgi:hypothetical protein